MAKYNTNAFPYTCARCSISLSPVDVRTNVDGTTMCERCFTQVHKRDSERRREAQEMARKAQEAQDADAVQRDNVIRTFLSNMPYSVLAAELAKHDLVIDDPFAKAAYTHATGNVIPETDVYGVCSCNADATIGWHSYVRSDGTINGWHEAVSKVKAQYDTHVAQRLVPALQEHSRLEMLAARERNRYTTNNTMYESQLDQVRAYAAADVTNAVRITTV